MEHRFAPAVLAERVASPDWQERAHAVRRIAVGRSVRVAMPALRCGLPFVTHWPIRESPGFVDWRQPHYDSIVPAAYTLAGAVVLGAAGIVLYADLAVAETLHHTDPSRHGYRRAPDAILADTDAARDLPGTYVSALAGGDGNHFHTLVDCVGRLSAVPREVLRTADGILVPAGNAVAAALLHRLDPGLTLHPVAAGATLRVGTLILPGPMYSPIDFHPCLPGLFEAIAATVPVGRTTPPRFYVDRRAASFRRLANEDALIDALATLGVAAVQLETLPVAEQIRLFRDAELVVAPHGAGLTNLLCARAGCRVLELQMDAYVNWSFRRIAALRGLSYDCVLGRARGPWGDIGASVHGLSWSVSVPHVLAAVEAV